MPKLGTVFYFSTLPVCLLNIIGRYAGDVNRPLVFTLTPKRKYIGPIFVKSPYKKYLLKNDSWIPRSLGDTADAVRVRHYMMDKVKASLFLLPLDLGFTQELDLLMNRFTEELTKVRTYSLT